MLKINQCILDAIFLLLTDMPHTSMTILCYTSKQVFLAASFAKCRPIWMKFGRICCYTEYTVGLL